MQVYQTNNDGVYVEAITADPDPLTPNGWLIPGGCVETEPPELSKGQRAQWTGDEWAILQPPQEAAPEPEQEPTEDQVRVERDQLLLVSDWTQVLDAPVDQAAWATYRQALRDVPEQEGFPSEIAWPTQP